MEEKSTRVQKYTRNLLAKLSIMNNPSCADAVLFDDLLFDLGCSFSSARIHPLLTISTRSHRFVYLCRPCRRTNKVLHYFGAPSGEFAATALIFPTLIRYRSLRCRPMEVSTTPVYRIPKTQLVSGWLRNRKHVSI
jgi:hypothetical protein